MTESISSYFQFCFGSLMAAFSLMQIVSRNKTAINYLLSLLYFCIAFIVLYMWLFRTGFIVRFRYLMYQDITQTFLIGPVFFLYLRAVLGISVPSFRTGLLHFLPSLLSLAVVMCVNAADQSLAAHYSSSRMYFPDYSLNRVLYWGNTAANAGLVVYSVRSIALILRFMFVKEVKPVFELRFLLCYMSGIILFAVLTFVASLTMNNRLLVVSVAALSFLGFLYYFMSVRYPEFLKLASQEARAVRVKTLIDDNNSSEILRMMDSLMHEKKLFTDDGLSVGKTAEALGVTAHLLSRIINEKTGNNFRAYLNSFRVKEASALLLGNPDMSVIEIAYAVGFSSKSSFNEVFHRITGVSPREYRIRAGGRVESGDL